MARPTLLLSANEAWNLAHFRQGLIKALAQDFQLAAAAPDGEGVRRLKELGCSFHALPLDSHGTNPLRDVRLLKRYVALMRALKPAAYLGFTVKPNIYGALAAQRMGVASINNISGLGTAFIAESWVSPIVRGLYRLALRRAHRVFFQNSDDLALFQKLKLVRAPQSELLPGSGVDLQRYAPQPTREADGAARFLFIGRMLGDKGVREFLEAARLARAGRNNLAFTLVGPDGAPNPTAVPREELSALLSAAGAQYLGTMEDVREAIARADCVVLPSYREGTPRVLLEAAAMRRPLIATDVPGCRDVVEDGVNGLLVPVRDSKGLAEAFLRFAALSPQQRDAMGQASRSLVEARFDERIVIDRYRAAIGAALARAGGT